VAWPDFAADDKRAHSTMVVQTDVEREIMRLARLGEENLHVLAERAEFAAVADATYKREHAQAVLKADADTVAERDAQAALVTADAYLARRIAEARLMACQEAGRAYRSQLDALRSINANLRAMV